MNKLDITNNSFKLYVIEVKFIIFIINNPIIIIISDNKWCLNISNFKIILDKKIKEIISNGYKYPKYLKKFEKRFPFNFIFTSKEYLQQRWIYF